MATTSEIREGVLDLLWSQWHEFGVAATVPRRHSDDCLDAEALIAFTAAHSDLDPRLRDESIDWVLRYGTYVSRARLKNILTAWEELGNELVREYSATLNAHGSAKWPAGHGRPVPFRARARATLKDLSAPALLSLRTRAIFGVGARAELIRAFLSSPHTAMTASDLAVETGYGKRNVLNELEPLRLAGFVKGVRSANADRYSVMRLEDIRSLLRPLPRRYTRWAQTFAVLSVVLRLIARSSRRSDLANAADALRLLDDRKELFARADIHPPTLPTGAHVWPRFVDWFADYTNRLSRP